LPRVGPLDIPLVTSLLMSELGAIVPFTNDLCGGGGLGREGEGWTEVSSGYS
jgi:hypothetical protein